MFNNVLVVDSSYSLLIYLTIFNEKKDNTLYIVSDGICSEVRNNFKEVIYLQKGVRGFIDLLIKCVLNTKLRGVLLNRSRCRFYGHDHLFFSPPFISRFTIIEDGLSNYCCSNRKFPVSMLLPNKVPGDGNNIERVLLSGIKDVPTEISNKVEYFSLKKSWDMLSVTYRDSINSLFSFDETELEFCDALLLTQPLSEDGFILESEKIEIYQDIINQFGNMKVVIKPHPREKTNYTEIMTGCVVVDGKYPAELICLNSKKINTVITIFSTSIYSFSECRKVFIGTERYPSLMNKVGTYSSCELI
ncbi:glycosyltransferase family 52 [Aeromonas bivalvium]|uniref:glycosyltransferase family 52 n=1 Tax=Aeromonas bivalvium TaxID=440079 RepID=UPI0013A6CDE0|nr:glycosyltransferase family 52 [Aeromonas bivalvium]